MVIDADPTRMERALLDDLERASRLPAGRTVVHLHLSALLPSNRKPIHLRIASRLFAPLEVAGQAGVYPLSSGDIVILGKNMPEAEVDRLVHRVRSLFADDPLAYQSYGDEDEDDPFVTWYALEVESQQILAVVKALLDAAEIRRRQNRDAPPPPTPLAPGDLDDLKEKLKTLKIGPFLRRQPCIRITPQRKAEIAFEEFFVAVGELREALAPTIDLFANRWLFQELSRDLDAAVLLALPRTDVFGNPRTLSLNLNLETLETPAFEVLLTMLGSSRKLVVEVQVIDVFTNLSLYQSVRDRLRRQGHSILIDGLSPPVLVALDLDLLDPDFIKVQWFSDLAATRHTRKAEDLTETIASFGSGRVILARCDSEAAIAWGVSHGILSFQGRFIDAILASVTMTECPRAGLCNMKECANRRASVGGKKHFECPNPPGLDAVQSFSAPGVGKSRKAAP